MARKHVLSLKLFNAESISATTSSKAVNVGQVDYGLLSLSWSGSTLVGTASVEVKNGPKEDWQTLDIGGTPSISGAAGSHDIIFNEIHFTELRLTLNVTSGTGTLDAAITVKSKGA